MKEHDWKNGKWKENKRVIQAKEKLEDTRIEIFLHGHFSCSNSCFCCSCGDYDRFNLLLCRKVQWSLRFSRGTFFCEPPEISYVRPERGDLIVFRTNASDEAALHIRRVIGLPGETVQIKDGQIFIKRRFI